ncbi:MAG: site-2 protease family protein [Planctomycetes bacterium]|nr:site-2 protease family protein [Planctomycetota bacterium]
MDAFAKLLSARLRVGQVRGVDVFVHWTLFVAAAWLLVWLRAEPLHALLLVLVLGASVLLHELGHCWAARGVGGDAREVVLWPLGGLADVQTPRAPWPRFAAAVSGPLVNVALVVAALPPFLALGGGWSLETLGPVSGPPVLAMIVFVNGALALFNLLPAYPMDGGRALQAALWPRLGEARATRVAITVGLVVAAGVGLWALLAGHTLVVLVMAFVASSALRARARAGEVEPAWAPAGPPGPGPLAAWRARRRRRRQEEEARRREAMRARLDLVLEKVSREGLDGLTREERRFLARASRALRQERVSATAGDERRG